jgi:hypothetical protein
VLAACGVLLLVLAPEAGDDGTSARPGGDQLQAFGSLATIRPDRPPPPGGAAVAALAAAAGEQESFQIAVEGGREGIEGVGVVAGELDGPGEAKIPAAAISVYREDYYEVAFEPDGPDADSDADRAPSDGEGEPGLWPDALIPERDAFYGEDRSAFPYDVAPRERLVAWVDVSVPPGQRPGLYRGEVAVSEGGEQLGSVPLELRVRGFELPATSSLPSAFGLDSEALCVAHTGRSCDPESADAWLLAGLYERAALDNRTTLSAPYPSGPSRPPAPGAERDGFEEHILPLAKRMTAFSAYGVSYGSAPEEPVDFGCARAEPDCLGQWRRLAKRHGFADRFFLYLCDEPGYEEWIWALCAEGANNATASGWPRVPRLVTAAIQEAEALGAADIANTLAVPIEKLAAKEGDLAGNQRPAYDEFLSTTGKELWLYTACGSFGCDDDQGPAWDGWAGYAIDQPASQARAVSWLAFLYDARGELYYNTTIALAEAWQDQYRFGGNGDGTLFYPGLPDGAPVDGDPGDEIEIGAAPAIGGEHAIPIESIRLKRIRDGREDYEYLRHAAAAAGAAEAFAVAAGLFGGTEPAAVLDSATHAATFSQAEVDRARCELARLIEPSAAACP